MDVLACGGSFAIRDELAALRLGEEFHRMCLLSVAVLARDSDRNRQERGLMARCSLLDGYRDVLRSSRFTARDSLLARAVIAKGSRAVRRG